MHPRADVGGENRVLHLLDGGEGRLVDLGQAPGEAGEIMVRGPTVFQRYHGRPEPTAEAITVAEMLALIDDFLIKFREALKEGRVRTDSPADVNTLIRLKSFLEGEGPARRGDFPRAIPAYENAIEAALQLCAQAGGRVVGISLVDAPPPKDVMLKAPAMGMEVAGYAGPLVWRGKVYAGFSDGTVTAFDARTGALRWAWDLAPPGMPPPWEPDMGDWLAQAASPAATPTMRNTSPT